MQTRAERRLAAHVRAAKAEGFRFRASSVGWACCGDNHGCLLGAVLRDIPEGRTMDRAGRRLGIGYRAAVELAYGFAGKTSGSKRKWARIGAKYRKRLLSDV